MAPRPFGQLRSAMLARAPGARLDYRPLSRTSEPRAARWREDLRLARLRLRWREFRAFGFKGIRPQQHALTTANQTRHLARLLLDSANRAPDGEALLLLAESRSGTQWVRSLLGNHPAVMMGGELWNPAHSRSLPAAMVPAWLSGWHLRQNLCWQARTGRYRYSGASLLLSQMAKRHIGPEELERLVPGARFLVLIRREQGLRHLSLLQATASRQWALRAGEKAVSRPVHVDPDVLRARLQSTLRQYRALAQHPVGQRALWLIYEELEGAAEAAFGDGVWPYLGLDPVPLSSPLQKQRVDSVAERVLNFDEVRDDLEAASVPLRIADGRPYCLGPPLGLVDA